MLAGLGFVFRRLDPAQHPFPACPFLKVTGYKCPGCGSQRAIHQLLNGNLKQAFLLNPLLVMAIPYILVGWIFDYSKLNQQWLRVRSALYGLPAIRLIFVAIIGFWIGRNIML
ncbi:MAG: DUF2752 domain-containing protein [Cyclobacteriaceae bacterium]|nr:DUF2752 domain-containing protein [Cyclobacteriaceae bacterium]